MLTTSEIRQAKVLVERLDGKIDVTSALLNLEEAILLERFAGLDDEAEARFLVSVARGIIPGDVRKR